jgi:NADH:ubiquinone oxidoreductase subunit C
MNKTELAEYISKLNSELLTREGKQYAEVQVSPALLHKLMTDLKKDSNLDLDYMICLSGVDYGNELGVIYHLRSTSKSHTVVVKTKTDNRENPEIESVTDIWATAEFHEREVYDLLGIKFLNHPDLRRLFLDRSWGFPLRKDYKDDVNIVTK